MRNILMILAVVNSLVGCQVNPVTGDSNVHIITESQAVQQSALAYSTILSDSKKAGKLDQDSAVYSRVRNIFERLLPYAKKVSFDAEKWDWEFHVISDPTLNAWCMAGGRIAINTGLIDKLHVSDDELAFVMAHEMGHALGGHTAAKQSLQILTNLALLGYNGQHTSNPQLQQKAHDLIAMLISLPYSRGEELEADQTGLELLARAGYQPEASITLWKKMMDTGGLQPPEFQSTHPSHENRIKTLGQQINSMKNIDPNQKTLSLVAPIFTKFMAGEMSLECNLPCSIENGSNRKFVMELYDNKRWKDLAIVISKINFPRDLNYYYLGIAAEELGYKDAAVTYYKKAIELSKTTKRCGFVFKFQCNGIEVPDAADRGLKRLQ